jgi:hypothetical protein
MQEKSTASERIVMEATDTSLKSVMQHVRELHKFVERVESYGADPIYWPLTHDEQVAFIRTVIYQAHKLRKTEGYVTATMILASEDLALAS